MTLPYPNYSHKQYSPWPLLASGLFFLRKNKRRSFLAVGLALLATQVCSLTIRVDERGVSWNFGFSLPTGHIPFDDIADVQVTQTGFLSGMGVRWTPQHGWLWQVSGRDAVMIRKKDRSIITLGTNDATGLYNAIASGMRGERALLRQSLKHGLT